MHARCSKTQYQGSSDCARQDCISVDICCLCLHSVSVLALFWRLSSIHRTLDPYSLHTCMPCTQERVVLLEAWRDMERTSGDSASLRAVDARMPRRLKKKRMLTGDSGEEVGWEEYYDYRCVVCALLVCCYLK